MILAALPSNLKESSLLLTFDLMLRHLEIEGADREEFIRKLKDVGDLPLN